MSQRGARMGSEGGARGGGGGSGVALTHSIEGMMHPLARSVVLDGDYCAASEYDDEVHKNSHDLEIAGGTVGAGQGNYCCPSLTSRSLSHRQDRLHEGREGGSHGLGRLLEH